MFAKRKKREYPPGTFISTPKRVLAILQLCIAFTILIASASHPFIGELFAQKSQTLLYHNVMGNNVLSEKIGNANPKYRELLKMNAIRFEKLPESQKTNIIEQYDALQAKSEKPFLTKLWHSIKILILDLPAFERAWLVLTVIISIMLLKRVEGSAKAAWLLPIVALLYALNNYAYGEKQLPTADSKLFPSEQIIVQEYLKEPLSQNILEQQPQLLKGWNNYLIKNWAHQIPSEDLDAFSKQAEEGEYAFNVARLEAIANQPRQDRSVFHQRESVLLLALYVLWNLYFAWRVNKSE
jgi:hypothetical protein